MLISSSAQTPTTTEVNLRLHPKQQRAFFSKATEILYGGAAGGGKSHLFRAASIAWCCEIPGLQVYIFRRTFPDLHNSYMVGPSGFPAMLQALMLAGLVSIDWGHNEIKFWNNARIHLCHCQHEKDIYKYLSAEFHVLIIDESTQFTAPMYRFLRARCRVGGLEIPEKYADLLPRVLCGSNPGNIGHNFFKASFIDIARPFNITKMPPSEGGMRRQFIPALLEDNPTLTENDPEYENKLHGLGDKTLVRAMRYGDWNIVAGGLLDELWSDKLILPVFNIPESWSVDRSFDWGSSKPYACCWWAESDGTKVKIDTKEHYFPRGSLIMINELYGWGGEPNMGTKELADIVARNIKTEEQKMQFLIRRRVKAGPADASIFDADGRPSIASAMAAEGVRWLKADKSPGSRLNGLEALRKRLNATIQNDMERPHLYFFETCLHTIRTLPTLPRDPKRPDDCDTEAEDHIYDAARYRIYNPPRYGGAVNVGGVY